MPQSPSSETWPKGSGADGLAPRILIVGGGFAGLEVAKALGAAGIGATLIDRSNHHLFQPLLYQVATAALSAPDIAEPIRTILGRYPSIQVLFGTVSRIDTDTRRVYLDDQEKGIPFDLLVLATGSRPSYFRRPDWETVAPGLKTIEDAREIRSKLLATFEYAERTTDAEEQRRLTTIAIIGGGPTGVELAGSIAELSRYTLARDFRNIRPERTRIMLIEVGDRLLSGFSQDLSAYAQERLQALGVEIVLGRRVEDIQPAHLVVSGEILPVGLTIWAAGVSASPLAAQLGTEMDRGGRVKVGADLRVTGSHGIFALGDISAFSDPSGHPLPGLAQVAKQQGMHLGRALVHLVRDGTPIPPFTYRSRGNTAIIGRHAAVFETRRTRLKGIVAWLAWAIIHVYLLVGFQHRVQVSLHWLWRYLTYQRGARLITVDRRSIDPARKDGQGNA